MDKSEYFKMDQLQKSNWWYLGRRVIVTRLWQKYFTQKPGKVLDVGCGTGEGKSIVDNMLDGIDESEEALNIAKQKGYAILTKGSADNLPFPDNSYSGILMLDVLEHISDDVRALSECVRVLEAKGTMLITVPAYQWLWSGHDEVFGHERRYTRKDLVEKIKNTGFEIIFSSYYVAFLFPVIVLYRAIERTFINRRTSHFFYIPKFLNNLLLFVLKTESILLEKNIKFLFGSSIVVVARKS